MTLSDTQTVFQRGGFALFQFKPVSDQHPPPPTNVIVCVETTRDTTSHMTTPPDQSTSSQIITCVGNIIRTIQIPFATDSLEYLSMRIYIYILLYIYDKKYRFWNKYSFIIYLFNIIYRANFSRTILFTILYIHVFGWILLEQVKYRYIYLTPCETDSISGLWCSASSRTFITSGSHWIKHMDAIQDLKTQARKTRHTGRLSQHRSDRPSDADALFCPFYTMRTNFRFTV